MINQRLDWDELFHVSTIHSFLWQEVSRFTPLITKALVETVIPGHIARKQRDDNGGNSQRAVAARKRIAELEQALDALGVGAVKRFRYSDTIFSDYAEGILGHDDLIAVSTTAITDSAILRKVIAQKYPYVFVDEAQDTFVDLVEALNLVCEGEGLPIVGYFGDPMQQIYEKRAGEFAGPTNSERIPKTENFRCSTEVISLLNAFRRDIEQYPAGDNSQIEGSVQIVLVQAEEPQGGKAEIYPGPVRSSRTKI